MSNNEGNTYDYVLQYSNSLPLHGVLALQGLFNLIPANLLMFWVAGQAVEKERDAAGCGVVALKHEGFHLCSYVLIWQTLLVLILLEKETSKYIEKN